MVEATTTIGSALSLAPDTATAIDEACSKALAALGGRAPSLVGVFASVDHAPEADAVAAAVAAAAPGAAVLGCCAADGVIEAARELEQEPALAVWVARFPDDAVVQPFHLVAREGAHGELIVHGWPELAGEPAAVLAIADPYTVPVEALLGALEGVPVIGGLAGLGAPGEARLFTTGGVVREGVAGVSLHGVPVVPLVSQGARPVGPELVVTAADGNAVLGLAGQPAVQKLRQILEELDPAEGALALTGLMLGRVIDENRAEHGVGDFLVRGMVGVDRGREALLVADQPRVGQLVRFHVRDGSSADEELRHVLDVAEGPAAGALLFSCNGRGTRMFSEPDHDADLVQRSLRGAPVAGMFCQGELGPVGGRTFLHGFTATMALFRPT